MKKNLEVAVEVEKDGHGQGQNNVDSDKLHGTHCRKNRHSCKNCWDLIGKPPQFNSMNTAATDQVMKKVQLKLI